MLGAPVSAGPRLDGGLALRHRPGHGWIGDDHLADPATPAMFDAIFLATTPEPSLPSRHLPASVSKGPATFTPPGGHDRRRLTYLALNAMSDGAAKPTDDGPWHIYGTSEGSGLVDVRALTSIFENKPVRADFLDDVVWTHVDMWHCDHFADPPPPRVRAS
jgi:hypothetical protein